ncbi:hypothetical protein OKA05_26640 [Luteolibacter arcticus]|uniref:PEP-CTERM protein-sorting domain-containing protein n=1 Tax=Luteolibacter arcticus TaxID=1581411 RepID=A0ABT3GRK7_9BACT|nr:hypothetical protein [Luteolibacter arcticus]MCW1926164.1 hypothetical protein [Luteolibacter arcticus]
MSAALPCQAVVTFGTSSGTGIDVDVSALSLADLEAGPLGTSSGTAPAMYATTNSVLTVNVSAVLGSGAATDDGDGAINSSANSNVDGFAGTRLASGTSTINGLTVLLVESVLPGDLLNITATTLGSTSTSSGDFGVLGSVGTSVFQDLNITVGGNAIFVNIDSSPAPNTILLDAGGIIGLTIVLNEQIATGDGISGTGLTTNALHVYLNAVNFGAVSAITGDIVVGQSISGLGAIPEPGIAVMGVLSGMLLMGRRRRVA